MERERGNSAKERRESKLMNLRCKVVFIPIYLHLSKTSKKFVKKAKKYTSAFPLAFVRQHLLRKYSELSGEPICTYFKFLTSDIQELFEEKIDIENLHLSSEVEFNQNAVELYELLPPSLISGDIKWIERRLHRECLPFLSCKPYRLIESSTKGTGLILLINSDGEAGKEKVLSQQQIDYKVQSAMFVCKADFAIVAIVEKYQNSSYFEVKFKKVVDQKPNWDDWAFQCIERYVKFLQSYFLHAYSIKLMRKEKNIIKEELKRNYTIKKDLNNKKEISSVCYEDLSTNEKDFRNCRLKEFEEFNQKFAEFKMNKKYKTNNN